MALSASTVWEIRCVTDYAGAADTNGGGFVTGASGTDYSFTNINANGSAKYALTNGVTNGTTTIATVSASADMIGNIAYVAGGTGSVVGNWYQITGQSTGVSITVDRSTGLSAGTGVTINIGGCLATPGILSSFSAATVLQGGQTVWIKYSTTPTPCSTSTAGTNGPCSLASGSVVIQGYDQSRGDNTGNRPSYKWTAGDPGSNTFIYTLNSGAKQLLVNLVADGGSIAHVSGFTSGGTRNMIANCVAVNFSGTGCSGFTPNEVYQSQASNCTTGFNGGNAWFCTATGGTTGFSTVNTNKCLASGVPTGFAFSGTAAYMQNCTADTCSTAGFTLSSSVGAIVNSIASNCAGTGFVCASSQATLINCASYNNTTIASGTLLGNYGPFASGNTLTQVGADPYVSQATGDFRLNANNPGGAQLRNAGIGVYGQTDNVDIGAVQHTDPAGGGSGPLCGYMGMP